MDEFGVKITGFLSGYDSKVGEYDGVKKVTYRYLLVSGVESFVISCDVDYTADLALQDIVTFSVVPRVFGGKIFYSKGHLLK